MIRDICAPINKAVEKISMTPLREIRENPRKVLIFRWYESTRKFEKKTETRNAQDDRKKRWAPYLLVQHGPKQLQCKWLGAMGWEPFLECLMK